MLILNIIRKTKRIRVIVRNLAYSKVVQVRFKTIQV